MACLPGWWAPSVEQHRILQPHFFSTFTGGHSFVKFPNLHLKKLCTRKGLTHENLFLHSPSGSSRRNSHNRKGSPTAANDCVGTQMSTQLIRAQRTNTSREIIISFSRSLGDLDRLFDLQTVLVRRLLLVTFGRYPGIENTLGI